MLDFVLKFRLATAMEEAINTVCMASLKLAAFYGLWTWLIHTVFRVDFVMIPTGNKMFLSNTEHETLNLLTGI